MPTKLWQVALLIIGCVVVGMLIYDFAASKVSNYESEDGLEQMI